MYNNKDDYIARLKAEIDDQLVNRSDIKILFRGYKSLGTFTSQSATY